MKFKTLKALKSGDLDFFRNSTPCKKATENGLSLIFLCVKYNQLKIFIHLLKILKFDPNEAAFPSKKSASIACTKLGINNINGQNDTRIRNLGLFNYIILMRRNNFFSALLQITNKITHPYCTLLLSEKSQRKFKYDMIVVNPIFFAITSQNRLAFEQLLFVLPKKYWALQYYSDAFYTIDEEEEEVVTANMLGYLIKTNPSLINAYLEKEDITCLYLLLYSLPKTSLKVEVSNSSRILIKKTGLYYSQPHARKTYIENNTVTGMIELTNNSTMPKKKKIIEALCEYRDWRTKNKPKNRDIKNALQKNKNKYTFQKNTLFSRVCEYYKANKISRKDYNLLPKDIQDHVKKYISDKCIIS